MVAAKGILGGDAGRLEACAPACGCRGSCWAAAGWGSGGAGACIRRRAWRTWVDGVGDVVSRVLGRAAVDESGSLSAGAVRSRAAVRACSRGMRVATAASAVSGRVCVATSWASVARRRDAGEAVAEALGRRRGRRAVASWCRRRRVPSRGRAAHWSRLRRGRRISVRWRRAGVGMSLVGVVVRDGKDGGREAEDGELADRCHCICRSC